MERLRNDIIRDELATGVRLLERRRKFNRQLRLHGGGPKKRHLVVKWPSLKEGEDPPQYDRAYLRSVGWQQKKLAPPPRYKSLGRHVLRGDPATERQVRAHVQSAWKDAQFEDGSSKKKTIDMYAMTDRHRSRCRACCKKYEKYGHTKTRPTPACRQCVKALCTCVGTNKRSGRCVQFRCARVL